jgi:hypothetical protein
MAQSAQYNRGRAADLRKLAEGLRVAHLKEQVLELAREHDRLAEQAERRAAGNAAGPSSPKPQTAP